jgi:hypothetical protein
MQGAIKLHATVLSGHRIEITAPELPEGAQVEVIVMLPDAPEEATASPPPFQGVADFLKSLPPISRTAGEWAAIEREFQEERNAWDR